MSDEKTGEAYGGLRLTSRGRAFPKSKKRWARGIKDSFSLARLEMIEETGEGSSSVLRKRKEGWEEGGQRER